MFPDDPAAATGIIVVALLALSWHEAAHAWVADRLGDPTARMLGRVTLNPLKHLDPFLSFLLPAALYFAGGPIIGGGKPVPINVANFRHRARDFMLVALAGPFSNLLLALGFGLLFVVSAWTELLPTQVIPNPYGADHVFRPSFTPWNDYHSPAELWLKGGVLINLGLAIFNLIPVPPLDGSRVIGWLLPRGLQMRWFSLDRIGFLILILLLIPLDGIRYVFMGMLECFNRVGLVIDDIVALIPLS